MSLVVHEELVLALLASLSLGKEGKKGVREDFYVSRKCFFPPRVRKTRFSYFAQTCFMLLFQFLVPLVEKVIFGPWTP